MDTALWQRCLRCTILLHQVWQLGRSPRGAQGVTVWQHYVFGNTQRFTGMQEWRKTRTIAVRGGKAEIETNMTCSRQFGVRQLGRPMVFGVSLIRLFQRREPRQFNQLQGQQDGQSHQLLTCRFCRISVRFVGSGGWTYMRAAARLNTWGRLRWIWTPAAATCCSWKRQLAADVMRT